MYNSAKCLSNNPKFFSEGRGVRTRHNGLNAEKAIVFHNFFEVSQGLFASIVVLE